MNKEYYETVDKIKFELEKIRPKLIKDGGNIEFINFKNGILKINRSENERCLNVLFFIFINYKNKKRVDFHLL